MYTLLPFIALVCLSFAMHVPNVEKSGANIALGKPYTLSPSPNYQLCTDPGDSVQLTDGTYTEGYFWTQRGTVGWQNSRPVQIVVDLGKVEPISGASFNTAAGVAGVYWPVAIQFYVSDDGKTWRSTGDLTTMASEQPPLSVYTVFRYRTDKLHCHGRYVAFQVDPGGAYVFCDELEVYRGTESDLSTQPAGPAIADLHKAFIEHAVGAAIRKQVSADASRVKADLTNTSVNDDIRNKILADLDAATRSAKNFDPPAEYKAIAPLCEAHRSVFEARAVLWREQGLKTCVWQSGAWDTLLPDDLPKYPNSKPSLNMSMLRGEVRSVAFNITNVENRPLTCRILLSGLPASAATLRYAEWTALKTGGLVASALPDAAKDAEGWRIDVPSGMTRQIWLSVNSRSLEHGTRKATVVVSAGGRQLAKIPVVVRVSRIPMPVKLSLSLGGWDYTDVPTYAITKQNSDQVVRFLKDYHMDAPWANAETMPFGDCDVEGRMINKPDTKRMDRWLDRWRNSRTYFVFNSFSDVLPNTPSARRRVTEWINFWVAHLGSRGVKPSQLGLLLVDEPREADQDRLIASYATVIHAAQPEIVLFEDPIWQDPRQATQDLFGAATMLCPNRPMWISNRSVFEEVFLAQQRAGKKLAFYSCSGPVRSLDPYSYHRLQAWDCFRYGAVHEGFWAFGDAGGGSAWNELAAPGTCFCPEYLGPEGCTTSKHMEAIREGLYDYETLVLLRHAVQSAMSAGKSGKTLTDAIKLLNDGVIQVTEAKGAESILWSTPKDRSLADAVRCRAIILLEKLAR